MPGEREEHFNQLLSQGIPSKPRETVVTERIDGDGVKRRYIDLGTVQLGGEYHDVILQTSPRTDRTNTSGVRIRRKRLPQV